MSLEELLCELRGARLDDNALPHLWSDAQLTSYLNDAVRQVCIRQRCLVESVNATVCQYSLAAGVKLIKLHPSILAVRTLRITEADGTHRNDIVGKTLRWVRDRHPCWETWDACCAHYWIPDYQSGYIVLDRGSEQACTVNMTCWRLPIESEELDANDTTGEPIIDTAWHTDLTDWAVYRAFLGKDDETLDRSLGPSAASAFDAKVGPLPSAAAIRLWGVSPIVGTKPQYL